MKEDQSGALLFCRFCLSLAFIWSGYNKIFSMPAFAADMAAHGMLFPGAFPYLAVLIELGGGLAILFGLWTRPIALLFAVYVLVATLIHHRFWTMPMPAYAINQVQFEKNVSMIGGFVLLWITGSGRFALDAMIRPGLSARMA